MDGLKRSVVTAALLLASMTAIPIANTALGNVNVANAAACGSGTDSSFLSFPTWHRNLQCKGSSVDLESKGIGPSVVIILLNIVDMALRLVGMVAVAFVIWGGFQYIIARGEPGNIAKAKLTLAHAIAGLIVGIASSAIVGFISGSIK